MRFLIKVKDRYYFNRRVPEAVREFDKRALVRIALKTDSRELARRKAHVLNEQLETYWQDLLNNRREHEGARFEQTIQTARQMGFSYLPVAAVAQLPLQELLERILAIKDGSPQQIEAVLGGRPEPRVTLLAALEKFWEFSRERTMRKTSTQLRKWRNPRAKAIRNLVAVIGDKDLKAVTREDILAFKDWWIGRIQQEQMNVNSANKDFINVKTILETVSDNLKFELDIKHLFKKIVLKSRVKKKRPPFTTEQIISILESERLHGLNDEAKWVLFAAAETGARPSELVNLLPQDIRLAAAVPHIAITDREDCELKTTYSQREIPLVGYALEAFQNMPDGFPRYRDKADTVTNTINKFLSDNSLFPSERHTLYSLRHSFQDRILSISTPDRIQAELMGHKFQRPEYGAGPTLEHKLTILEQVCVRKMVARH